MKKLLNFLRRNSSVVALRNNISDKVISNAYKTREKEIESLRKYDRGEKTITPSNLTNIVRGI